MLIVRHNNLTTGTATLPDGREFPTIELPYRDNKVNVSCIKPGIYQFKRDKTGKHQWFKVLNVEGRTNIEMHEGTKPEHSNGCILMTPECLNAMLEFYGDENLTYTLEIRYDINN